uniref:C-type lectin domain-containing protein n=1 Tax=Electrophorus electricus TaxID=8005 RepID=A0A4W4ER81_ELEEL
MAHRSRASKLPRVTRREASLTSSEVTPSPKAHSPRAHVPTCEPQGVTCILQTGLPYQYHFVTLKKNWTEAQGYCQEKYTDLATITNSQDLSSLMNATVVNSSDMAWIGLYHDINSWRWSLSDEHFYGTGEMEYRNWENTQPNNNWGQETCTMMRSSRIWNDLNCEC